MISVQLVRVATLSTIVDIGTLGTYSPLVLLVWVRRCDGHSPNSTYTICCGFAVDLLWGGCVGGW